MYVEHFGREVVIDADHPLAAAQRAKDAISVKTAESAVPADTHKAPAPAASASPDSSTSSTSSVPNTPAPLDPRRVNSMNAADLRELCVVRGVAIPVGATRKIMIALLLPVVPSGTE